MPAKKLVIQKKLTKLSRLFSVFFKKEQNLKEKNKKIVRETEAAIKNKAMEGLKKKIGQM
jgi:hypothetical protein